jgi:flagellar protein FliS
MSFAMQKAATYARVGIETGVPSADPHRLILMLYDGALVAIARARDAMINRRIAAKGESLSKAIQIVEEGLRASLDRKAGGEIAEQLNSLYEYISRRLLLAGMRNEPAGLDEATRLLGELRAAWQGIEPTAMKGRP